jgi:catechol 2,3-dioxygenase-like lactoylglutathione lyase family enzyme
MLISQVKIVSVPVRDADRAKAFYRDVLGFDVIAEAPMGPAQRWIQLGPKGGQASLTLVTWFEKMPAGSLKGLVLETPNVDAAHAAFRERGVTPGNLESAPWGRYFTLEDPDGNGLVVQQSVAMS